MKRILIVDPVDTLLLEQFKKWGWTTDYLPKISVQEAVARLPSYEGLVLRSKMRLDAQRLQQARKLCFIARAGAGLDGIDVATCEKRNIAIFRAPEGNARSVAEHVVGMVLALLHRLPKASRESLRGRWDREENRGVELMGKTVGIMGYGPMGQATATLLAQLGCRLLVCDVERKQLPEAMSQVSLQTIQQEADIVSLHVPLTDQTTCMVDEPFLFSFRKEILLVNTARGRVVDLKALWHALQRGTVWGAALDVLPQEPLGACSGAEKEVLARLMRHPHVMVTPHVAGWSVESYGRIAAVLAGKIKALYQLP